jgi:hypothetical protein
MTVTGSVNMSNNAWVCQWNWWGCPCCGAALNTGGSCYNCGWGTVRYYVSEQGSSPSEAEKKPHKCPCCDGAGKVSRPPWIPGDVESWTSGDIGVYECRSCNGTGVVWG